jgi:hypothetical protein
MMPRLWSTEYLDARGTGREAVDTSAPSHSMLARVLVLNTTPLHRTARSYLVANRRPRTAASTGEGNQQLYRGGRVVPCYETLSSWSNSNSAVSPSARGSATMRAPPICNDPMHKWIGPHSRLSGGSGAHLGTLVVERVVLVRQSFDLELRLPHDAIPRVSCIDEQQRGRSVSF